MCYAKPGPRCSAHARGTLVRASLAVKKFNLFTGPEEYMKLKEKEEQAKLDFDATPAGQQYLERRMNQHFRNDEVSAEYEARKNLGKARREEQLALLKSEDKGDLPGHHEKPQEGNKDQNHWISEDFPESDEEARLSWRTSDGKREKDADIPQVKAMVIESENWLSKLTPEEHEAVSWYTSDGAQVINEYQKTGINCDEDRYTTQHIQESSKHLRSAINKYDPPHDTTMVWRGMNEYHFENLDYEGKGRYSEEGKQVVNDHIRSTFKPGQEWSPEVSMSTSYDPAAASSFARNDVILEIKSHKAAPVCVASAWGVSEREAITHPDAKYRVISVKENIPFKSPSRSRGTVERNQLVVQLEEI